MIGYFILILNLLRYSELRNEQLTVDGSEPVPFVQPQTFKDVGLEKSVAVAVQDCLA